MIPPRAFYLATAWWDRKRYISLPSSHASKSFQAAMGRAAQKEAVCRGGNADGRDVAFSAAAILPPFHFDFGFCLPPFARLILLSFQASRRFLAHITMLSPGFLKRAFLIWGDVASRIACRRPPKYDDIKLIWRYLRGITAFGWVWMGAFTRFYHLKVWFHFLACPLYSLILGTPTSFYQASLEMPDSAWWNEPHNLYTLPCNFRFGCCSICTAFHFRPTISHFITILTRLYLYLIWQRTLFLNIKRIFLIFMLYPEWLWRHAAFLYW